MRFVMGLLVSVFASLAIGGVAVAAPEGKRIMLLGTANTNPYIGAWTAAFSKLATQSGMKVTNLSSNYDAAVQSQQVDDAIAQKFDMIVIVYVNDQAIIPALTRAKAAGIPVVLIVTPLKKEYDELFMSYIGTDHSELGRLAGEGMIKGLLTEGKTKAQVVAVTGVAQQLNVQMRVAAFKEALAKQPGFELVATEEMWRLLELFFTHEMDRQYPIAGAIAAMRTLAEHADVVVLTNLADKHQEARTRQLLGHGLDIRVFTNQGPKGPALQRILEEFQPSQAVFVDDIAQHHGSVAELAPEVHRLHFCGEPTIAPLIRCAHEAGHAHARIDDWTEALPWLLARLHGENDD